MIAVCGKLLSTNEFMLFAGWEVCIDLVENSDQGLANAQGHRPRATFTDRP